jgi:membrane protein
MATWLNQLRSKGNQIKQRLEGIGPVELVIRAIMGLSKDDGTHFAAGVAYYAFLSIFPLLLGLIALLSLIPILYDNAINGYGS